MAGKSHNKKKGASEEQPNPEESPKTFKVSLKKVTVMLAPFSQTYKLLTAKQFKAKEVMKLGNIALGERVFEPGKPYELEMTNKVQALIKDRVFQVIRSTIYEGPTK